MTADAGHGVSASGAVGQHPSGDASLREPGRPPSDPGSGRRRRRRGEQLMVPRASFESYYGRPILKEPTWQALDIAGYLFLGGLAGASSVLAAGAEATRRPELARVCRAGAAAAISLSLVALVHDLGKPKRFVNMLRVAKPTSPMSVGSWVLSCYAPMAIGAAALDLSGRLPTVKTLATAGAAGLGPVVASYTAVLLADTAVPAWHAPHRVLPFVFAGSAASAAGGLALLLTPPAHSGPARRMALIGAATETVAAQQMTSAAGLSGECFQQGPAGRLLKTARILTVTGSALALVGTRLPLAARFGGAALLAASACTRFGIFAAGVDSTQDPRYVVEPQQQERPDRGRP